MEEEDHDTRAATSSFRRDTMGWNRTGRLAERILYADRFAAAARAGSETVRRKPAILPHPITPLFLYVAVYLLSVQQIMDQNGNVGRQF
jgi:hypothetical protein